MIRVNAHSRALLIMNLCLSSLLPNDAQAERETWQCLCYQERLKGEVVEATACRATRAGCQRLEERVENGSKSLVRGSLKVPCKAVKGAHPAEALGSVQQWRVSKKAGAFWTPHGCLLGAHGDQRRLHQIKNQGEHSSLLLRSGQEIRLTVRARDGSLSLEAMSPQHASPKRARLLSETYPFKGDESQPRCAMMEVHLGEIAQREKRSLFSLKIDCEEASGDGSSSSHYYALITIADHTLEPTTLWSALAYEHHNETTGSSSATEYSFRSVSSQVYVSKRLEVCEAGQDPMLVDYEVTEECQTTESAVKTLKYP